MRGLLSDSPERMDPRLPTTLVIYAAYFSFSFFDNILSPCLLDLVAQTSSTVKDVMISNCLYTIGYCISCLVLAKFRDRKLDRHSCLCACLVIDSLAFLVTSLTTSVNVLTVMFAIGGISSGAIDVICNTWMQTMWHTDSNFYMYGMHFCYATGAVIVPFMSAPFLSTATSPTLIVVPFSIATTVGIMTSLAVLIQKCLSHPSTVIPVVPLDDVSDDVDASSRTAVEESLKFSCSLDPNLLTVCLLLCFYALLETMAMGFFTIFAVFAGIHTSKQTAAYVQGTVLASYALSRAISILTSGRLLASTQLVINFVLIAVSILLEVLFANTSLPLIWLSAAMQGVGCGSSYPSILLFSRHLVSMSDTLTGYLLFSSRLSFLPVQVLIGAVIENNAMIFVYVIFATFTLSCLAFSYLLVAPLPVNRSHVQQ